MSRASAPLRVLILTEEPEKGNSPAARFRFYVYRPYFLKEGIQADFRPAFPPKYTMARNLFKRIGRQSTIAYAFLGFFFAIASLLLRLPFIFQLHRYDVVILQRELSILPAWPVVESLFLRGAKATIFDYDDAIWCDAAGTPGSIGALSAMMNRLLRGDRKIPYLVRTADLVIAGNPYLADYGRQFRRSIYTMPTLVDTNLYQRRATERKDEIVIGWSGQAANLHFLEELRPVFQTLASRQLPFSILIISNKTDFDYTIPGVSTECIEWQLSTEVADLSRIDIGIAPMVDHEYTRGKNPTKVIQYMAMECPVVASPVGVVLDVISPGQNGFFASTPEEWVEALDALLSDGHLRKTIGKRARQTVARHYCASRQITNLAGLIRLAAHGETTE